MRHARGSTRSLAIALGTLPLLAACSSRTVPALPPPEPPPSPLPPARSTSPPLAATDLGRFPAASQPRWGVCIFTLPDQGAAVALPSPEQTGSVLGRLDALRLGGTRLELTGATLASDWEAEALGLGTREECRDIDLLLLGVVSLEQEPAAHLLVIDRDRRRVAARSSFAGPAIGAVLDVAVRDAVDGALQHWNELHRGDDVAAEVLVRGLRDGAEVRACHEALAALPDVHVARLVDTRVAGGESTAVFVLFFHGDTARLSDRLATVRWKLDGREMRLERRGELELESRPAGGARR